MYNYILLIMQETPVLVVLFNISYIYLQVPLWQPTPCSVTTCVVVTKGQYEFSRFCTRDVCNMWQLAIILLLWFILYILLIGNHDVLFVFPPFFYCNKMNQSFPWCTRWNCLPVVRPSRHWWAPNIMKSLSPACENYSNYGSQRNINYSHLFTRK